MSSKSNVATLKPEVAASYLDVQVPASPFLNESRIERINAGKYEGQEIDGALALVTSTDRVLELGAGLGVVGAVIAKTAKPKAMMSFEANPNLIPHIQELYDINGLSSRVKLHNQVLLASPDRPATIDFHLGNSFLGSSLVQQAARKQRKISVETADFEAVRKKFKPTILVMDIEGAELDFLHDADLTGIRGVVIEFHPALYGDSGMRRCKNILREQGFERVDGHSTRTVWTCQRTDVTRLRTKKPMGAEQSPPSPGSAGANPLQRLDHAQVVPAVENGFVQHAGVFDSAGLYCPQGALWRKGRPITLCPDVLPAVEKTLSGRWLWGGVLWDHFGHFIVESSSRLWPLPQLMDDIDGILFIPKRPDRSGALLGFQRAFFDQLAPGIRVEIANDPVKVEHLIVPEQGFGLGRITAGSSAFKETMTQHFAKDVTAQGGKKLYISRSNVSLKRGGILGEKLIETYLEAAGYEIFHPEKHDIATQVARYKAAESILSCEGSALHMFGMTARADQKVGIIMRRQSKATNLISRHIKSFTGIAPRSFDAIKRSWTATPGSRQHKWVGELDMPQLQTMLEQNGFIPSDGTPWVSPSDKEIKAELGPNFKSVDA